MTDESSVQDDSGETPARSEYDTDRELRRCRETGSVFVLDGPNVEREVSTCPHCGNERCLNAETDVCPSCDGRGEVFITDVNGGGDVECSTCNGSGRLNTETDRSGGQP